MQKSKDMYLQQEFTATGAGDRGAVSWSAPKSAASFPARGHPAQRLRPRLLVTASKSARTCTCATFTATGGGDLGAVRLCRGAIGSQLSSAPGRACAATTAPPTANGLQVGRDMFLSEGSPPPAAATMRRST